MYYGSLASLERNDAFVKNIDCPNKYNTKEKMQNITLSCSQWKGRIVSGSY